MLDFLPTLIAGAALTPLIAVIAVCARWGLIALATVVGVFSDGPKGKNARHVLKLLLRRKDDPPGATDT